MSSFIFVRPATPEKLSLKKAKYLTACNVVDKTRNTRTIFVETTLLIFPEKDFNVICTIEIF